MNRLHLDKLLSVGFVPEGDNPEAAILFSKQRVTTEPEAISTVDEPHAGSVKHTKESIVNLDSFDLPAEVQKEIGDHIATLEDAVADLTAQVEALTPEPVEDPVEKAAPEVQELVAKQAEQIAALQKAHDEAVAKQRDAEFVAHLNETGLADIFEDADEAGPLLRKIADAAPEEWAAVEPQLVAFTQKADLGNLFVEKGANSGEATPVARRDAWVTKYRQDNPDVSVAEARKAFWFAHPELAGKDA